MTITQLYRLAVLDGVPPDDFLAFADYLIGWQDAGGEIIRE